MAIRGRKPKPVALRVIEGNRSRRPLPDGVPFATGKPVRPEWLSGRGAAIWDEHVELLPWLAQADSAFLAAWCALQAELEAGIADMTAARIAQWRTLGAELGLSASSRTR